LSSISNPSFSNFANKWPISSFVFLTTSAFAPLLDPPCPW
jgi:hypothetical protein